MDTANIESILARDPGWLLGAVTTEEAAAVLSVPAATLTTWRSRSSTGPRFVRIRGTRLVRYIRIELYRWLLADGLLDHNGATGIPIDISETGKQVGSAEMPPRASSLKPQQGAQGMDADDGLPAIVPHPRRSRRRLSNSRRGQPPPR